MNNDFRIKVGALKHIKIRRLIGRHGAEAFVGLVRVWDYAAFTDSPNGELIGLTSADIAMIAEVDDDAFGDNLVQLNLLNSTPTGYKIHNWKRHNPWCSESQTRSESARTAAEKRWHGKDGKSK